MNPNIFSNSWWGKFLVFRGSVVRPMFLFASFATFTDHQEDRRSYHQSSCDYNPDVMTTPTAVYRNQLPCPSPINVQTIETSTSDAKSKNKPVQIAIIGGGIAGVSAAVSIMSKIQAGILPLPTSTSVSSNRFIANPSINYRNASSLIPRHDVNITIYEADSNYDTTEWRAATALNAQSIVPSVAMHCLSQRETLLQIIKHWKIKMIKQWRSPSSSDIRKRSESSDMSLLDIDEYDSLQPSMLKFSLLGCLLDPSCSWDKRKSFLLFLYYFVKTSIMSSPKEVQERGRILYQLAQANYVAFKQELKNSHENTNEEKRFIGESQGFIALYRSMEEVQSAINEASEYGYKAKLLTRKELDLYEPNLAAILPTIAKVPLFAVYRPNDGSASCAEFVRQKIQELQSVGVHYEYKNGHVVQIVRNLHKNQTDSTSLFPTPATRNRFCVMTSDGSKKDFDYIILAAGARTPLLAQQLGIVCPTYPLRGWSLSITKDIQIDSSENTSHSDDFMIHKAFSIDRIYCSSTSPYMARLAGFGELVGYQNEAKHVSSNAPRILVEYAKALLGMNSVATSSLNESNVQPCFRPLSPDDVPLVGPVSAVNGVFIHTGHGTLGWTLALATAYCLAQSIEDQLVMDQSIQDTDRLPLKENFYILPDGSTILRSLLSPDRFFR